MARFAEKISDDKYSDSIEIERTSKLYTRNRVPSGATLKILDIGCGTGLNAKKLAEKGHEIIGIDISNIAIQQFCQNGFTGFQCDIAQYIPFKNNTFDLIYASEVIEHLIDTELFIDEIYRILKPSGKLILSTINSTFWVFRITALLGKTVTEIQHPGHIRFFSKAGLTNNIAKAGFKNIKISGRHMYLILTGRIIETLGTLLERIGFKREIRFRTKKPFWHLSHFSTYASSLFTDTFIVEADRP